MIETSKKGEPSIFETDDLCMYAGDEQPLEDMFMQVAKEMKLLEEMDVIEQCLIENVFKDTKDGQMLKTTKEAEDDESSKTWQKDGKQFQNKRKVQITKGGVEERYEDNLMTRANKSVCAVQTLEVM